VGKSISAIGKLPQTKVRSEDRKFS